MQVPALAVLLPLTLVCAALAARPARTVVAPVRLAVLRGALVVGTVAVLTTEGLGALHLLTGTGLLIVWTAALAVAATLAARRRRPARSRPSRWAWPDLALLGGTVAIALAELVIALVAPPNTADSQSYHLPRVEHWAQDRSVDFYPTAVHRQVGFSPGAEYLLLQLRLLAGPEEFYNLVQWAAALGCAVLASRIAAQLGAGRRGQLVAAVTVATAPLVVLEATSTQTDLVAAFWVACGVSLAFGTGAGWLGLATGLTAVTKVNGLATLAPFLVLWCVRLPLRWRSLARCAAVLALTVLLAGPFTLRCAREWGRPAGDPGAQIIALGRHDPPAVGMNALRISATVLGTGSARLDGHATRALNDLASVLRLPARDARLTFTGLPFAVPVERYPDEDHSGYPLQALAVLGAIGYGLCRRSGYAMAAAAALVLNAAVVAWQPWINRLILPAFVAGVPLVGSAAADLLRRRRLLVAAGAALVLLAGYRGAAVALWSGQPRPLGGPDSVLTAGAERTRYARGPSRQEPYRAAAARLAASGARRIGVVQSNVGWEYPWWVELRRYGVRPTLVSLTSAIPKHPPAKLTDVDAVICTLGPSACARWLPGGWQGSDYGLVTVLLPAPDNEPR